MANLKLIGVIITVALCRTLAVSAEPISVTVPSVDQSHLTCAAPGLCEFEHVGFGPFFKLAQSFTVGTTGILSRIDLQLIADGNPSIPVTVEIVRTKDGVPLAGVDARLGRAMIAVTNLPGLRAVDFSSQRIMAARNDVLAVVLSAGGDPEVDLFGWGVLFDFDSYSRGFAFYGQGDDNSGWRSAPSDDFIFRTWMAENAAPVPEPSPLLMFGSGVLYLLYLARKQGPGRAGGRSGIGQ